MDQTTLKFQLLAELLRVLKPEGLPVDQHLRLQELLAKFPEEEPIERLCFVLSPVLAKNEEEQERFYALFKEALARVRAVHEAIPEEKPKPEAGEKKPRPPWLRWAIGLLAVVVGALLLAFLFSDWEWLFPGEQPIEQEERLPQPLRQNVLPDSTTTFDLTQRANPAVSAYFLKDSATAGESPLGRYSLIRPGLLQYTARDSTGTDRVWVYTIDTLGVRDSILCIADIREPQPYVRPTDEEERPFDPDIEDPVPSSLARLVPEPLPPLERFISEHQWWLRWALAGLSGLLIGLIVYSRERRRRQLIAELEKQGRPPYHWDIELPEEEILLPELFERRLSQFRRRAGGPDYQFDIPATIEATVENAGMVDFRYRRQTHPPEYLFLIGRQVAANHCAQLFDQLYRYLRDKDVLIERFFYDGDVRHCYNEHYPEGLQLAELQYKYPNARLVVLGLGYQLISAGSGKVARWAEVFKGWKQRSLLTPRPIAQWGRRERILQEFFLLAPARLEGLAYLAQEFDNQEEQEPADWKKQWGQLADAPVALQGGLAESLRAHYSEPMLQWIAACAVYPSLHWPLTLYLGRQLSVEGEPLVTFDNLNALSRLPWFVSGQIPRDARAVLLTYLEEEYPELLRQVREQLHHVLQQEENIPPKNSDAWDDYRMNLYLNEWLFTQDEKRKKELEKEIEALLEEGLEADFTIVKYLNRKRSPLDFIVPESWKKYLPAAGLKLSRLWKDLFWALPLWALLILLAFRLPAPSACHGGDPLDHTFTLFPEERPGPYCLKDARDSLLAYQFLAREAVRRHQFQEEDSLSNLSRAIYQRGRGGGPGDSTALDMAWLAYRRNVATEYYRLGAGLGNRSDSLRRIPDLSYPIWRDSACALFERGRRLDTTWVGLFWPRDWCRDSTLRLYRLSGAVYDSASLAPLGGVLITYRGKFTETDREGRYSLQLQPYLDSMEVQYSRAEYDTLTLSFALGAGARLPDSIHLARKAVENPDDPDNDGVLNPEDGCDFIPGPPENGGCPETFEDLRDGQVYPIVVIGGQAWMGRNLNYAAPGSWCYLELPELCQKAGRLYTWEAAQTACPQGWRLPDIGELDRLLEYYGDASAAYRALIEGGESRFNALLGGYCFSGGEYVFLGRYGLYWSVPWYDAFIRWGGYGFDGDDGRVSRNSYSSLESRALSCRCLKDDK